MSPPAASPSAAMDRAPASGLIKPPRRDLLAYLPAATLLLFLTPVAAGLLGTLLPAFGWLPALGGDQFGLAPWRELLAAPGLAQSVRLSLASGIVATLLSPATASTD